ncbi:MAG: acylphosphatase [Methanosarcina sp.]
MTSGETVRAEILVSGRVQGMGFRRFARNAADRFGVDCSPINPRVFVIETPDRQTSET